jgi:hypothetical protein
LSLVSLVRSLGALLLAVLAATSGIVRANSPAADAEPVIVYIETDPWAMVIGSDSPRFVLYDDGTVIYRTDAGYQAANLMATYSAALAAKVNLAGIKDYTDYTNATDQPSSIIIDFRDQMAAVAYGATSRHRDRGDRSDRLLTMITLLREYQNPDAKPWEPEAIEVMIWPYEYAPEASIIWPAEWPGLDHPATVQRGDSYSLFVPISEKGALLAFLETRERRGAVELGGRKWAVSLRTPLPREARWMRGMDTASSPAE